MTAVGTPLSSQYLLNLFTPCSYKLKCIPRWGTDLQRTDCANRDFGKTLGFVSNNPQATGISLITFGCGLTKQYVSVWIHPFHCSRKTYISPALNCIRNLIIFRWIIEFENVPPDRETPESRACICWQNSAIWIKCFVELWFHREGIWYPRNRESEGHMSLHILDAQLKDIRMT